jgi:hypothetical protein
MIWAIASAVLAVSMEWWFRSHGTWALWLAVPAVMLNYCIYRLVTSDSLLSGIILFTAFSVVMRLAVSVLLGEIKSYQDYGRAAAYLVLSMWR